MRITCIGGGPAGLYFALLMKKRDPAHDVTVLERNRPDDTFGWGVVFSDQTLGNSAPADPETYDADHRRFAHWDDIDVHFKGGTITSGGTASAGIGRKRLLNILQRALRGARRRARVRDRGRDDRRRLSRRRSDRRRRRRQQRASATRYADAFQPEIDAGQCRFVWLGTQQAVRRLHLRLRGDRARLVPGARLPVRRRHFDLHRREPEDVWRARRPRPDEHGGIDRLLRAAVRRVARRPPR